MKNILDKVKQNVGDIVKDEFGRPHGILLIDKPANKTSHDLVDEIRKKYSTRKVGHAGTLDPFATGLLVVLVGKATKLSNDFLGLDKTYKADILFGVTTDSGDIEGNILKKTGAKIDSETLQETLQKFTPNYEQYVPIFSSVKVNGKKLRKLARQYDHFEISKQKEAIFYNENNSEQMRLEIPKKLVNIYKIDVGSLKKITKEKLKNKYDLSDEFTEQLENNLYFTAQITVKCSKGTYIRQLAVDIGEKMSTPAMLVGLRRVNIDEYGV